MKINIIDYFDVWGNKKEGWEINNWFQNAFKVKITDIFNKKKLLKIMKRLGYIKPGVRTTQLLFEEIDNGYEISLNKTNMPLFRVEKDQK